MGEQTNQRTVLGTALYQSLPAVYRTRDESGHLREYLDACGALLDDLRGLIDQRLADSFPSSPGFQPWLLPYVADLLGVPLQALDDEALSAEVKSAIRWRQRKGTLPTAREIVEVLGQFIRDGHRQKENEPAFALEKLLRIDEGWKRVARTPRVGKRYEQERKDTLEPRPTPEVPLPMPAARTPRVNSPLKSSGDDTPRIARSDPFHDRWPRTPDMRPIDLRRGHAHPRSVLVFVPNFCGFFYPGWEGSQPRGEMALLEDLIIPDSLTVANNVTLRRCAVQEIVLQKDCTLTLEDCLVGSIHPAADSPTPVGTVCLAGVTVLTALNAKIVRSIDSLLPASIDRAPDKLKSRNTELFALTPGSAWPLLSTVWGRLGCGVLAPDAPESLRSGAEDGGELGAYHHRRYVLRERAIVSKLEEYLPLGSRVVVIPTAALPSEQKQPLPQGAPKADLVVCGMDNHQPLQAVKAGTPFRLSGVNSSPKEDITEYDFTLVPGWFGEDT